VQLAFYLYFLTSGNSCAFNAYSVLLNATTCVRKIHAVKLKNKLRTTVTTELKIDIYTLALIMFKSQVTYYRNYVTGQNQVYVKLNKGKMRIM